MSGTYTPNNQEEISQFIYDSYQANKPLEIVTFNSKPIGRSIQCSQTLDLRKNSGVIEYAPEELFIKVKAGTPLIDILEILKSKKQCLGFEPVDLGYLYNGKSNYGSIGGVTSCNLSGPRRFKSGALRDHLLGFTAVNGKGECIKSGGTVVKNVTGYDLSKLLAGSYGTLSVLTELVFKVVPEPEYAETFILYDLNPKKPWKLFP
jgi:glycolate oxidase FAD binding subunit